MNSPNKSGELLANLLHFARLLRRMGIMVSIDQFAELSRALPHVDFTRRQVFYYTARCFLVKDRSQFELFDKAFDMFWQGRQSWMVAFGMTRQTREVKHDPLSESRAQVRADSQQDASEDGDGDLDADPHVDATYSAIELLRSKTFEEFTDEELALAKAFIHSLRWHLPPRPTRRQQRAFKRAQAIDLPRTVRRSMPYGGEIMKLYWQKRKRKPRPLVVICDISGSMDRYSRLFLHFLHTMSFAINRVEVFVFGTRLTRITGALRHRDIDAALDRVAETVIDWSGGTRIGESLHTFNYDWSRRVLGRGAVVIVISDGWDRGDMDLLSHEMNRLSRSASRLIWLNPLAGADDYEPLVKGMETALPFCHDFLPLHNLHSLMQLATLLGDLEY